MLRYSINRALSLLWLASAAMCALHGCATPPAEDLARTQALREAEDEAAKSEVQAELESYYRDFSARKWSAFAAHFWPGATITTIWKPTGEPRERVHVQTVPEFLARTPEGPDSQPIFSERMASADIRVDGSLADAWTRYEAEFGKPGAVAKWSGTDAFTLMRFQGRWRIVALAFAPE